MKKLFVLFVLAFLIAGINFLSAQAVVEDGKISVTPNWSLGESATYDYTHISYFKERSEVDTDTLDMELELSVAEILDTNMIMQAKYSLKDTKAETNKEKLRKDLYHGTKIFYTTKANGSFEGLTSMNLLISVVRYAFEKNWKVIQENPDLQQKPTKEQIMQQLDMMFAQDPEGFIKNQVGIGQIFQYLHSFYGDKLNMEDTTMFPTKVSDPFEKDKEHEVAYIAKINKLDSDEGIIDVSISLETNEKEGFILGYEFFRAIDKQIEELDDAPETIIKYDMRFVVDLASGWVKEFEFIKDVSSKKAQYLDKKIVKMKE